MAEEEIHTCKICGWRAPSEADAAQCEAQGEIPFILPEGTVFEETILEDKIYHVIDGASDIAESHLRKYKMATIIQHKDMPDPLYDYSFFEVSRDSKRLERGSLGISRNTRRLSPLEIEALPQNTLTSRLKVYLKDLKARTATATQV